MAPPSRAVRFAVMRTRRFRPFRLGLWLGAIGAAAWFVQRYQRSRAEVSAPTPSGPSVPTPSGPSVPIARPEVGEVGKVAPEVAPQAAPAPAKKAAKKAAPKQVPAGWVAPDDEGICPPSHPIKAKLSSKLFHLPGMFAYARTKPDRCYRDEATAEADGLTKAKR